MTPSYEGQVPERRATPFRDLEDYDFARRLDGLIEQKEAVGGGSIMAGGSSRCPICHKPFSTREGKSQHIDTVHSEAAELYRQNDPYWVPVRHLQDGRTEERNAPLPPAP
jgi:hypothetical protein